MGTLTDPGEDSALLAEAAGLVIDTQFGSVTMLQRRMRAGFDKITRLVALLIERGILAEKDLGDLQYRVLVPREDKDAQVAKILAEGAA